MARTEEIITEKELSELSSEIMKTVNNLNSLLNRAAWANLWVNITTLETQEMGQKYPVPILQVALLKEI